MNVDNTGSKLTRFLGSVGLCFVVATLCFGLWFSGPEVYMRDSVRLLYIHVPSILTAYMAFAVTFVGSVIYLRNSSKFWDLMAAAAGEIGVLFLVFTLITGALWGKPTWGAYWVWDPRLTSTVLMLLMYLGYLAIRRLDMASEKRSRRAAVVGIVSIFNVIIVHYSVTWWRGQHQAQTFGLDTQLDGLMLFSAFMGMMAFASIAVWLLVHRFRVGWLEYQLELMRFEKTLAQRRSEATLDQALIEGR